MRYHHIATKFYNRPLLIHPDKGMVINQYLSSRMGFDADDLDLDDEFYSSKSRKPYQVINNIAIIPITGTLVQKTGALKPVSGMTGYDTIKGLLYAALADNDVHGILLESDSGGGEVCGVFDLADTIYNSRKIKPIWGLANEASYSAAYALLSATSYIILTRTAGVGSIGVVLFHTDLSKALEKAGEKVTAIYYGKQKIERSNDFPLTTEAIERMQEDVDQAGQIFVETVARNRNMSTAAVKATEAGTFIGKKALQMKLADEVLDAETAFIGFSRLVKANHDLA